MLWRGIAEYFVASRAEWLFGCATVSTQNPRTAALLYRYFIDEDRLQSEFFAPPTLAHTMPNLNFWLPRFTAPLTEAERHEARMWISPLFQSFLERGAILGGEPAIDADFQCLDFLTVVHRDNVLRPLQRIGSVG
jgi:putative hemolysin